MERETKRGQAKGGVYGGRVFRCECARPAGVPDTVTVHVPHLCLRVGLGRPEQRSRLLLGERSASGVMAQLLWHLQKQRPQGQVARWT